MVLDPGSGSTRRIRVVVADDEPAFGHALKLLLDRRAELEVVAIAVDGLEAIDLAALHDADVVVMDVRMPRVDGFEAASRLLRLRPETRVLMISAADDDHERARSAAAGASGFLRKDRIAGTIVDAILRSVQGAQALDASAPPPP